jgi:RNA polymerase sigma factor (sigma-70 family)
MHGLLEALFGQSILNKNQLAWIYEIKRADLMSTPAEFAAMVANVASSQDRTAFARLFDHFAPRLNAYLIRMGTDTGTAEEIVQDTLSTLWRKAALFDPTKSSVSTWLYRIARNRRIDVARRSRSDSLDPNDPALQLVDTVDLDKMMDAQQREDAVRLAMTGLPEEQLVLVRLAFFEGLSHSEVAERTGLPLGTVKSRIRLAFTKLRRALEADGVVEAG